MTHIFRGVTVEALVLAISSARIAQMVARRAGPGSIAGMRRSRRGPDLSQAILEGLAETLAHVDRAKQALLGAVPSPRGAPGTPLAEALLVFEGEVRAGAVSMASWREPRIEDAWQAGDRALRRALTAAERLRLAAPALDYEGLVAVLGDLMDPLDAFEDVARAVTRT